LFSLGFVQLLVFAVMLSLGQDARLSAILGPEGLAQLQASLQYLPHGPLGMASLERLIALLIHIALSLVVWRAVQQRQLAWLGLAVLLHAVIDFPVGLAQAGELSHPLITGWLLFIGGVLVVTLLYGLPRKAAQVIPQHA